MNIISVLEPALPVFAALGLGMLCRRTGFLTREGVDTLKKVVVNLTLPAVLLSAFATAEYSVSTIAIPLAMFLSCCLSLGLGFLLIRLFRGQNRLAPFLATGFEAGMLGYALFALLFRGQSMSSFAILDIGHTLFVFTVYKILLSGKTDWKAIGRDMATTPILWAVLLGVLIGATGLYKQMSVWGVSGIFDGATDFVAAPTGMIILLTVGYDLVLREISWKGVAGLVGMRLVVVAACYGLLIAANRLLLGSAVFEGAILLMMILPPPYVIPVFTDRPEQRVQVSSALSALTLMTMLLFAALSIYYGM